MSRRANKKPVPEMPLCSDKELEKATKTLEDSAEYKRQHSRMTQYLKGRKLKDGFDTQDITWKREYFRRFVGNHFAKLDDKALTVNHDVGTEKSKERKYEYMTEEIMRQKKGDNWTTIKLHEHNDNESKEEFELKDPKELNRWLIEYKVYTDRFLFL